MRCNANRSGSETQVFAVARAPPRVELDVSAKLRGVLRDGESLELVQAADAYFLRGSCSSWLYALWGTGLRSQMTPIQESTFKK